jgi:serine/threonine-protein kinase
MHGRIGAYRPVRRLGGTDCNEVFLALAQGPSGFERAVVLKVQPARTIDDPELADRLIREAIVYARLTHPAIVQLYDLFEHDQHVVMVREYVHGVALAELLAELSLRRVRLPDPAAIWLTARIYDALSAAHAARHPVTGEFAPVVHRDVTPANVLVPWDGYAKLADFGMAKVLGRANDTAVGVIKGSYGYLAPEQVLGDPITVRTDVYGAALLSREMLTARPCFPRGTVAELEYLKQMAEPRLVPLDVLRPDLPGPVLDAMRIATEPDPDLRAISAVAMLDVLRASYDLERGRRILVDLLAALRDEWRRAFRQDPDTPPNYERPSAKVSTYETPPRGVPIESVAARAPAISLHPDPHHAAVHQTGSHPASPHHSEHHPGHHSGHHPGHHSGPHAGLHASQSGPHALAHGAGLALAPHPTGEPTTTAVLPLARRRPGGSARLALLAAASLAGVLLVGGAIRLIAGGLGDRDAPRAASRPPKPAPPSKPTPAAKTTKPANPDPAVPGPAVPEATQTKPAPDKPVEPDPKIAPAPADAGAGGGVAKPGPTDAGPSAVEDLTDEILPGPTPAGKGWLLTPHEAKGHRVFVDGKFAGGSGTALLLNCGKRAVKVGSAGKKQDVEIPCGGVTKVDARW